MWLSIDVLSEKYQSLSPYNYVANSPIQNFDPDGKQVFKVNGGVKFTGFHAQIAFNSFRNAYNNGVKKFHFVYENVTPQIYKHTLNAFQKGKPSILHYDPDKEKQKARRNEALKGIPSKGPMLHRDEYPYASTYEGGSGAVVEYVPNTENSSQGGSLKALYATMTDKEAFLVIPVPSLKAPETVTEPVDIPRGVPVMPIINSKIIERTPIIIRLINSIPKLIVTPPLMEFDPMFYERNNEKNQEML